MTNDPQTPCYIIHKKELEAGMAKCREALQTYWSNAVIGYSFKTNSLPWVVEWMRQAGCYAEVVSEDEYRLAKYIGYPRIIYNGPVKGKEGFFEALAVGHIVNLDAKRELRWLEEYAKPAKVGIRVNFDLEAMCPGEASGGEEGGRFGFSYETGELAEAIERLQAMKGVELVGIHLHCGSKTRSLAIYQAIAQTACRIRREYDLQLEYVDVGGGYFGGLEHKPKFADYLRCISEELNQEFSPEKTTLIIEPGTSLITPPIDYVSTVVDVKRTNRNCFVVTDGSRIDIDPLMTKKSYFYEIEQKKVCNSRENCAKQVVCGFTCMENDRLFLLEDAQELMEGDKIIYHKVGGYTMCLTPLFIHYFPAVYVEEDGKYTKVREHWSYEQYVQNSVI